MHAIGRSLRITSKKLNLIAGMVRRKEAAAAIDILKFTPKKGARILGKILKSAVANAENNYKQDKKSLFIKEIIVTEGSTLKRSVPVSRGRTHPILKRMAHATVRLGVMEKPAAEKSGNQENLKSATTRMSKSNPDKKPQTAHGKKESEPYDGKKTAPDKSKKLKPKEDL